MTTATKTRKNKFTADPQVAEAKRKDAMDKLEQGIQSLLDSGRWQQWLTIMSRLRSLSCTRYSWQNCLLILMQNSEATVVAGFHDWKKVGRSVKKGEKGLAIRAPFTKKLDEIDDSSGEPKKVTYFNLVYVWDIEQTTGPDLPELPIQMLVGDDAGLFKQLQQFAQHQGIPVNIKQIDCNGYCRYEGDKPVEIAINVGLSPMQSAKTLVHELAHSLLHSEIEYRTHDTQSIRELEAESTAFIVCNHFNLDTSSYSFGYIVHHKTSETVKAIRESADRIQKASNQIIEWLEACDQSRDASIALA